MRCLDAFDLVFCFCLFEALYANFERDAYAAAPVKHVFVHPPSATCVVLPDGRYMAYKEQGVSSHKARFSVIAPHSFLSSRLAGCFFF